MDTGVKSVVGSGGDKHDGIVVIIRIERCRRERVGGRYQRDEAGG